MGVQWPFTSDLCPVFLTLPEAQQCPSISGDHCRWLMWERLVQISYTKLPSILDYQTQSIKMKCLPSKKVFVHFLVLERNLKLTSLYVFKWKKSLQTNPLILLSGKSPRPCLLVCSVGELATPRALCLWALWVLGVVWQSVATLSKINNHSVKQGSRGLWGAQSWERGESQWFGKPSEKNTIGLEWAHLVCLEKRGREARAKAWVRVSMAGEGGLGVGPTNWRGLWRGWDKEDEAGHGTEWRACGRISLEIRGEESEKVLRRERVKSVFGENESGWIGGAERC